MWTTHNHTADMCRCTQRRPPLNLQGPAVYVWKCQTYRQAVSCVNCVWAACAMSRSLSADREQSEQAAEVGQAHLLTASWGSTAATR